MSEPTLSNRLDVWRIDLAQHDGLDVLSEDERQRAERFLIPAKRAEFTVARSALRCVLGRVVGEEPRELRFALGEHGRPELVGHAGPNFNLSHSSGLALIAVADVEQLGVDVERRQDGRPFGRLVQRFFSLGETREYQTLEGEEPARMFYRGWTRKEAYLKAWGTGLTFSSRGFTLSLNSAPARVIETGMPGDDGRGWSFRDLYVGESHAACVCWRGRSLELEQRDFEPQLG